MRKTIYALTALALLSPSLTYEARAGNPCVETRQRLTSKTNVQTPVQPKNEQTLINIVNTNSPTFSPTFTNQTLERKAEVAEAIPTPPPAPVPQGYSATQYGSQPQTSQSMSGVCKQVQPMPEVCKPVQRTPMIIQGAPEVRTVPQTVYAPTVVVPSPTVAQPQYTIYERCVARPFGGVFAGLGRGLAWLFAGPRHYDVVVPYGAPGVIHTPRAIPMRPMGMGFNPMLGFGMPMGGMPIGPMGPFGPHFMNGNGPTPAAMRGQYRPGW